MKLCTIPESDARAIMEDLAFLECVVNALDWSSLPPNLIKWELARGAIHRAEQTLEHVIADAMPPAAEPVEEGVGDADVP